MTTTSTPEPGSRPEPAGEPSTRPGADASPGPDGGRGSGGMDRTRWVVLAVALAFLVGAGGYFIGARTVTPPTNEVDTGFLQDMSDHHDQAVRIAQAELTNGADPVVKGFAMEVILFQRRELGIMQTYQQERGILAAEYDPERLAMGWMEMPVPLASMNGMATPEQLDQLDAASGVDADRLFLELMIAHHLGGVHMAEYARDNAADPNIRLLADRMARNQLAEVGEYQATLDRLSAS